MTPRTIKDLSRMSDTDCRAMLSELCGITQAPSRGCRHDWLPLDIARVLVESEWIEGDHSVGINQGWMLRVVFVNGAWVDYERFTDEQQTEWADAVDALARKELEDHRAQEFE